MNGTEIRRIAPDELTEGFLSGFRHRQIIRECALLSADHERMLWSAREEEARLRVLAKGTREIILSQEEKKKIQDAMEPLYLKYCADYMDIVEQIRSISGQ